MTDDSQQYLKDFIIKRFAQLDAAEGPLRLQLAGIKKERDLLRRAALAAGIEVVAPAGETEPEIEAVPVRIEDVTITYPTMVGEPPPPPARSPRRLPEKTIKEAVLDILKPGPKGMTAVDILAEINRRYKADYPRTSLSPQLSRLKTMGLIKRKGTIWRYVRPPAEKPEAADPNLFEGNGPATSNSNQH